MLVSPPPDTDMGELEDSENMSLCSEETASQQWSSEDQTHHETIKAVRHYSGFGIQRTAIIPPYKFLK